MAQRRFATLRADIAREVGQLTRLLAEAEQWRPVLPGWPETVRARTMGGILHDFYSAAERIFRQIATRVDEDLPRGADSHVQLLHRMATAIEGVRPAVLDADTARLLHEYLRFRHLFRNVYGFDLEWDRCQELMAQLPSVGATLRERLAIFDQFLRTLEHEL